MMTKHRTLLAAAVIAPAAALAFTLGGAGGLDDTAQIKQNTKDFIAAWNKHDTAAMSKFWARDGDLYCADEKEFKTGPSDVQGFFKEGFDKNMGKSTLTLKEDKVRFITPDVALEDTDYAVTGCTDSSGNATGPMDEHVVMVLKKEGSDWKIAAARPFPGGGEGKHEKGSKTGESPSKSKTPPGE
jgi:uncharacterized protein (TIGR02246 family)